MGGCRVGPLFAEAENEGAVSVGEEQCGDRPSFGALSADTSRPARREPAFLSERERRPIRHAASRASQSREALSTRSRDVGCRACGRAQRSRPEPSHARSCPACCPAACARAPSRRPEFGRSSKPLAYAMPSTARPSASRSSACNSEAPAQSARKAPANLDAVRGNCARVQIAEQIRDKWSVAGASRRGGEGATGECGDQHRRIFTPAAHAPRRTRRGNRSAPASLLRSSGGTGRTRCGI